MSMWKHKVLNVRHMMEQLKMLSARSCSHGDIVPDRVRRTAEYFIAVEFTKHNISYQPRSTPNTPDNPQNVETLVNTQIITFLEAFCTSFTSSEYASL